MISIRPKWCQLIADGEKTVEVRKTRPNIETPFRCFIYCTKPRYEHEDYLVIDAGNKKARAFYGGGRVVGEFVCDRIFPIQLTEDGYDFDCKKMSGMEYAEMSDYLAFSRGFGWHISSLRIYSRPKPLGDFTSFNGGFDIEGSFPMPSHRIKRPPQSWCYVRA